MSTKLSSDCINVPLIQIEDRISVLKHDMIQKLTNKRYLKIYAERFGANEQIFWYL